MGDDELVVCGMESLEQEGEKNRRPEFYGWLAIDQIRGPLGSQIRVVV